MDKLVAVKHDVPTMKLWCGPAVLSATTGEPISKIMDIAKRLSGKSRVEGMTNGLVQLVASELGYDFRNIRYFSRKPVKNYGSQNNFGRYQYWDPASRPTLAMYVRKYRSDFKEHAVVVNITGHYVAVHGRKFCDNHTCSPVFLSKAPFRRARVQSVWVMRKKGSTTPLPPMTPETTVAPKPPSVKTTKRLASGLALWKKAGCPTREDFIKVYGPEGPKMTWKQRAAAGIPAEKFQKALEEKWLGPKPKSKSIDISNQIARLMAIGR